MRSETKVSLVLSQPNNKKKENEKLTAKNKEKRFMYGCLCISLNAQKYQKVALWHYLMVLR